VTLFNITYIIIRVNDYLFKVTSNY